jgi:NADH-quinone oxidoreductase subunit F
VVAGPLLRELASTAGALERYAAAGGYAVAARAASDPHDLLLEVHRAGVRGRAGGGYPTAHKWYLVSRHEVERRFFVCNANVHAGDAKVPYLLTLSPHAVVEGVVTAALLCGAAEAFLAVPAARPELAAPVAQALAEAQAAGATQGVEVRIVALPDAYVAGEETALLESIEARSPRPRLKPPLPTAKGLFGGPTAVNNLETVLQAWLALRVGAEGYRQHGSDASPGTLVFSVQGEVARPGLYELPLGTPLREVVVEHAGADPRAVKMVFPGGWQSPPVAGGALEVALDYDGVRDAGTDLGSGAVIVIGDGVAAPELAVQLASFFHEASCGKCRPCKDGTKRALTMLERLDRLDQKSIDLEGRAMPQPKRRYALRVLGQPDHSAPSGVSYTDMTSGLAKIEEMCEFFKHRGDCHHSYEAATVLQRLIELFRPEFEARIPSPAAPAEVAEALVPA